MAVFPIQTFETAEPFFLVRFTGREYPLAGPVGGADQPVAKSVLLWEPQHFREIEEEGRRDNDEATATLKAELSFQNDGQWIVLPTADDLVRMQYNTGYLLCMSFVKGEIPSSEDVGRLLSQPSNLTAIIHQTTHLFLRDCKRDWWMNILAVSADEFALVLEKEASKHLGRPATVCYGPVKYYDIQHPPVHREYSCGRLREQGILYYFDKEKSYGQEQEYRFVVTIDGERQNRAPKVEISMSPALRACFLGAVAVRSS